MSKISLNRYFFCLNLTLSFFILRFSKLREKKFSPPVIMGGGKFSYSTLYKTFKMIIEKDNTFLDFLVIRLNKKQIDSRFFSCVENSPILPTLDLFWIDSRIEFEEDYHTHKIYYIFDSKNNKLAQIMLVSELNKRSDFYDKITFYWVFWNFYLNDSYSKKNILSNIFWFFGLEDTSPVTRFDIKNDVSFVPRFKPLYLQATQTRSQWTTWFCYSNKYKTTSASYEFRIYDKRLDVVQNLQSIQHNNWTFPYKELLRKKLLWRIEIQYNSKKIKEKKITLYNLFDDDFLHQELTNYCIQFLDEFSWSKKYIKQDKTKQKISFKKNEISLKHTSDMFEVYLEKLLFFDKIKLIKILKDKSHLFSDVSYNDIVSASSVIYSLKAQVLQYEAKLAKYQEKFWQL